MLLFQKLILIIKISTSQDFKSTFNYNLTCIFLSLRAKLKKTLCPRTPCICQCKKLFWTVRNSFFHKLYLFITNHSGDLLLGHKIRKVPYHFSNKTLVLPSKLVKCLRMLVYQIALKFDLTLWIMLKQFSFFVFWSHNHILILFKNI